MIQVMPTVSMRYRACLMGVVLALGVSGCSLLLLDTDEWSGGDATSPVVEAGPDNDGAPLDETYESGLPSDAADCGACGTCDGGRCGPLTKLEAFAELDINSLVGAYRRSPVENAWHEVQIEVDGADLIWRNSAGYSWLLIPDLPNGKLTYSNDSPYPGRKAEVQLKTDGAGGFLPEVRALWVDNDDLFTRL